MEIAIYILTENDVPVYVGKSKVPHLRAQQHRKRFPNAFMEIIEFVEESEWQFWEVFYVSLFRSWGFKLQNKNGGGSGSHTYSIESRLKMSLSHSGQIAWNKGKKLSREQKEKISIGRKGKRSGMKGKRHSHEAIKKQSESHKKHLAEKPVWNKGKKGSQIPWNKGKRGFHHSDDAKRKIASASIGNKHNLGRKLSVEHRMKISDGLKRHGKN